MGCNMCVSVVLSAGKYEFFFEWVSAANSSGGGLEDCITRLGPWNLKETSHCSQPCDMGGSRVS